MRTFARDWQGTAAAWYVETMSPACPTSDYFMYEGLSISKVAMLTTSAHGMQTHILKFGARYRSVIDFNKHLR